MLGPSTYRLLGSFGLLLLFLLPIGMREAHYLLEHHEAIAACDASDDDQHLHGDELIHHDCIFCIIHYTQFLEAKLFEGHSSRPSLRVEEQFTYSFLHNHPSLSHVRKRGPPCSTLFS